jgi:hypothetical protein
LVLNRVGLGSKLSLVVAHIPCMSGIFTALSLLIFLIVVSIYKSQIQSKCDHFFEGQKVPSFDERYCVWWRIFVQNIRKMTLINVNSRSGRIRHEIASISVNFAVCWVCCGGCVIWSVCDIGDDAISRQA